jgi:hypothetical protein
LWPRVENLPSFVVSKLRRFLYFVQIRVEVGRRGRICVPGERGGAVSTGRYFGLGMAKS